MIIIFMYYTLEDIVEEASENCQQGVLYEQQ